MMNFSWNSNDSRKPQEVLNAFRFYGKCLNKNGSLLPEEWLAGERECFICRAVTRTLYRLSRQANGAELLKIIELVYFADLNLPQKKGDMSMRVVKASLCLYYSERQIYTYLKVVRECFYEVLHELEIFG